MLHELSPEMAAGAAVGVLALLFLFLFALALYRAAFSGPSPDLSPRVQKHNTAWLAESMRRLDDTEAWAAPPKEGTPSCHQTSRSSNVESHS